MAYIDPASNPGSKPQRLGSTVGTVGGEEQGRAGAGINRFNP